MISTRSATYEGPISKKRSNQAKKRSSLLNTKQLGTIIRKVRKAAGLSQIDMSKIFNWEQASLSRIENGTQKLSVPALFEISNYFDIKLEHILLNQVNYWELSRKFNTRRTIPTKYYENKNSTVRECLPLLYLIEKRRGQGCLEDFLDEFSMNDLLRLAPNEPISSHIIYDFVEKVSTENILSSEDLQYFSDLTFPHSFHGDVQNVYQRQSTALDLIKVNIINAPIYDSLFTPILQNVSDKQIIVDFIPTDFLSSLNPKASTIAFLSNMKKQFLNYLPKSFEKRSDNLDISIWERSSSKESFRLELNYNS